MDVIGLEPDSPPRLVRASAALRRGPVAAVLALAALAGLLLWRAATGVLGGSEAVTGSMALELQDPGYVAESALSDQVEHREQEWQGTITVWGAGERTGPARLTGSASYVPTDTGPVVAHAWGTAHLRLDGRDCSGTYAYSSYRSSGEGGGSVHVRCDGGAVFGATMSPADVDPPSADGTTGWRVRYVLADGYLVGG